VAFLVLATDDLDGKVGGEAGPGNLEEFSPGEDVLFSHGAVGLVVAAAHVNAHDVADLNFQSEAGS